MNRYIAVLLVLFCLALPVRAAFAQEAGEGYAAPTYPELVQTMVMMGGIDITDTAVADEYGKIVYCDLYRKNFDNDVRWAKLRDQIITRALQKKEYYRVKYEVGGKFYLGRYDFKNQYFPISDRSPIKNLGFVNLYSIKDSTLDCRGQNLYSNLFPMNTVLLFDEPLTIPGFKVSPNAVDKLDVRMEEAGDTDKLVYGRIRMVVTDVKGLGFSSKNNSPQMIMNGKVISVDFFLDKEMTKPIASMLVNKE